MNYFEIIKAILAELKRPAVNTFASLIGQDYQYIKDAVNQINKEVLDSDGYNVRGNITTLTIPAETVNKYVTVSKSSNINGEIKKNGIIIDNVNYSYEPEVTLFLTGRAKSQSYCIYNDDIYFVANKDVKTATVLYYTYDYALDASNNPKEEMELETDKSIIPKNLITNILVYGACLLRKGSNSSDARLAYWLNKKQEGIRLLNAYNQSEDAQLTIDVPANYGFRGG
jgi:hypothetical protein